MLYVVSLMVVVFLSGGVMMLIAGLRQFVQRREVAARMQTAMGTILHVHQVTRLAHGDSGSSYKKRHDVMNFPVIQFRHPDGQDVQFRSEVGDTGRPSQYRPGMQLEVLYDPRGEEAPMLKSWSGVYLAPSMFVVAGVAFLGGAAVIAFTFGSRFV